MRLLASSEPRSVGNGAVTAPGAPQRAGATTFTVHQRREQHRPQSFASRRRGK